MPDMPTEPQIDYPCKWDYTVIADSETSARRAVDAATAGCQCTRGAITPSRRGNYISFRIEVIVASKSQRDTIFAMMKNSDGVRMVM